MVSQHTTVGDPKGHLMGMHQAHYEVTGHGVHGGAEYQPDTSHRHEGPPKGLVTTRIIYLSAVSTGLPVDRRMTPFE